jgi:hypothetical protein
LNLLLSTATLTLVAFAGTRPANASSCPVPLDIIKEQMVQESVSRYPGPCPCPYFVDRAVRPVGANRRLLRNRRFALRTLFNPHAASITASSLSESAPD